MDLYQDKLIHRAFQKQFPKYKKNQEQQKNKVKKYQLSRKPTLIIVPDVSNNDAILKETNSFGIPALGLVNAQNQTEVAYPIFVNDFSFSSVHFFCNFLSSLILKEFVKNKHKVYNTLNKTKQVEFDENMNTLKDFLKFKGRKFLRKKKTNKQTQKRQLNFVDQKPFFKGRYFLENFLKPRSRIKKKETFRQNHQLTEEIESIDQEKCV